MSGMTCKHQELLALSVSVLHAATGETTKVLAVSRQSGSDRAERAIT